MTRDIFLPSPGVPGEGVEENARQFTGRSFAIAYSFVIVGT